MRVTVILLLGLTVVAAAPKSSQRIMGGELTSIEDHPEMVALLYSWDSVDHRYGCGGTIINNRSILTGAQCLFGDPASRWQARIGSSFSNSGGTIYETAALIVHPNYSWWYLDNDIGIVRTATAIQFSNVAMPAAISGASYNLADNEAVWAVGWGNTAVGGAWLRSEELRHVQIWTINQATCVARYGELAYTVTDNMFCAGWLDVGGRDSCDGDGGGPILHNDVIVGIISWSIGCAQARYPGVNTRVPRYTNWILDNA